MAGEGNKDGAVVARQQKIKDSASTVKRSEKTQTSEEFDEIFAMYKEATRSIFNKDLSQEERNNNAIKFKDDYKDWIEGDERRKVLAGGFLYYGIMEGGEEKAVKALGLGLNFIMDNEALPDTLKGMGKYIRIHLVDDANILTLLDEFDILLKEANENPSIKITYDTYIDLADKIDKARLDDPKKIKQKEMIIAHLLERAEEQPRDEGGSVVKKQEKLGKLDIRAGLANMNAEFLEKQKSDREALMAEKDIVGEWNIFLRFNYGSEFQRNKFMEDNFKNLDFKNGKFKITSVPNPYKLFDSGGDRYCVFPSFNYLTARYFKEMYNLVDKDGNHFSDDVNIKISKVGKPTRLKKDGDGFRVSEKGYLICESA